MPAPREFGWPLKPTDSSSFAIHERPNGQFCVVLNHALLRGVRAEMIHWWFQSFAGLKVRLEGVPGYEGKSVPGYLLWHPVDHLSAALLGRLGPGGTAVPGCKIHIREAMQYDVYGWKYPVDTALEVFYVAGDGWAMGKVLPFLGPVMVLRIHFKDVFDGDQHIGVHYHYEVVIGASGNGPVSRFVNKRLTASFGPEFFSAWHRHNVIEVGTFENFLPALFSQRGVSDGPTYRPHMNPVTSAEPQPAGFDKSFFERRLAAYRDSPDPFVTQAFRSTSFL